MLATAPQGADQGGRRHLVLPDRRLRFGAALERDTSAVVTANGGKVLGGVKHPLNTSDFSSFLLQAQNSKARSSDLPMPRRHHHSISGGRVRHRRRRPEARCAAAVHHDVHRSASIPRTA